jgi:glycosyltransferase involved in cell wall biosynthesis
MRFIVFAEDWGSHPSSTQHLFSELAKKHEVHWVNSVGMRKPRIRVHDIKRVFDKVLQLFSSPKTQAIATPGNMKVYKLPILPWHDNRFIRYVNKRIFSYFFKANTQAEPVNYWLSVPTALYLVNTQSQDKVIYYCGDDFSALAGVDADLVAPFEKQLIATADLIYVISDFLLAKMPAGKTKMLSHGVSVELFSESTIKADEIKALTGPVVGFYGSINAWLDIDLLEALAAARPDYQLVLIGHVVTNVERLLSFKNVTHIPAVCHKRLASFSAHWDVSILPFVINEQIRACDPLKLKEYLAAGKPIVTTGFPAVNRYDSHLFIADTAAQFINQLDSALALSESQLMDLEQAQQHIASQHSWQSKASIVVSDMRLLNR